MDDLISRQAALEKVRAMQTYKLFENDDMLLVDKAEVQTELMMLPTVQPEVLACGNGELIAKLEPTDEQVAEYCKRRCLHIVTDDFFHTAQPEPKEGHWIDKGWDGDWAWQTDGRGNCWRVIECSECGKSVSVESNYCPHCGADMRGEQDGNA